MIDIGDFFFEFALLSMISTKGLKDTFLGDLNLGGEKGISKRLL